MSLEPMHELDSKALDVMQQVVFDFEENQLDACLRRIDNVILWRSLPSSRVRLCACVPACICACVYLCMYVCMWLHGMRRIL
jgi:hypothetical protein